MQKTEERQLEISLDALIQRTASLKNSIALFIEKLEREHEIMTWPTMLDSFALLSSELNSLTKQLKNDKMFPLRNYAVLPVLLSPDCDEQLERLTEGRVPIWNHETAPSYLRTKLEPEVEKRLVKITEKSVQLETLKKQANSFATCIQNLVDTIASERDQFDSQLNQKTQPTQTFNQEDTSTLLLAVNTGKQLRHTGSSSRRQEFSSSSSTPNLNATLSQGATQHISDRPAVPGKAPSSMKPLLRGAANVHPYGRP